MKPLSFLFRIGLIVILAFSFLTVMSTPKPVSAATITVCSSGCDYDTIKDAVEAASPGDEILISGEEFNLNSNDDQVEINKANLTIRANSEDAKPHLKVTGAVGNVFKVMANGVTIQGLIIEKTDALNQNLIYVQADNFTFVDNEVFGKYVHDTSEVSRAFEVAYGSENLTISNNEFHHLRQVGYFNGSLSSPTTGLVENNTTYYTKGWVIDGANFNFQDNHWGVGSLSNVYDIAILAGTPSVYYPDLIQTSRDNNDAVIEDQRLSPALLTVVYVDSNSTYTSPDGGRLHPYTSIQNAVNRVMPRGKIYIADGMYTSATINISKPVSILGESREDVIIKAGSLDGYGLDVSANNFTIENVTIEKNNNANYGLKISGSNNVVVKNVEVKNYNRSGIDLIGCNTALIEGVNSHRNGGVGIAVSNSTNITLRNITTSNNLWGGVGLFTNKNFYPNNLSDGKTGLDGITLEGVNSFGEVNPLYTELADASHVICNFTQMEFAYVVRSTLLPLRTGYQKTKESALAFINAANTEYPTFKTTAAIQQLSDGSFYVFDTMKIQPAIDLAEAGKTIYVYPGTFVEQLFVNNKPLTIKGSGRSTGTETVIRSPATLASSYSIDLNTYKPVVLVKDSSNVTIQDLVVDGDGKGNANNRFIGVGYFNSGGLISNVEIKNVQDTPFSGAQHGVALYIYNGNGQERQVEVKDSKLVDFQKNGTVFFGSNLTVNFHDNEVIGKGPTPITAQNGVQFSGGASGEVKGNTVTGIAYTGATWTASGILLYEVGNVTVEDNELNNCQTSIYLYGGSSVITNNVITTSKAGIGGGSYLTGIAAADPPFLPPSPVEIITSLDQSGARNATNDVSIMDSGDVVVIQNNIVNGGGDDPTSVGIGAWAGYTDEDVSFTITNNDVSSWGYGLDVSKCIENPSTNYQDCSTGEFISITLKENKVHQNGVGMYTNVEVDASLNWWGTLSWYGYSNVTGIKDLFEIHGDGDVDWQPWRNETLTLSLDIPTITYADDDNAGKTEGQVGANGGIFGYDAFATIEDALNHVAPGGTVYVGAGNYSGDIQINKAVTLIGQNRPVLDGRFWVNANNVTIQGFEIRNGRASTGVDQSAIYISGAQNVTIRDNHLIGTWTGGATNYTGGRGILTSGNVGNLIVEENTIERWVSGLYLNPTSGSIIVKNNEIRGNWAGAGTDEQGNVQFRNNYFRNNIEGIGASGVGASFVVEENAFIGNTTAIKHYDGLQIEAERNWWGSQSGPTTSANPGGSGQPVVGVVDFAPWLCDGSDAQPAQIGFQPVADAAGCTVTSAATRLVFTQYPDGGFENVPFATQPVVRAEDNDGNLAVNFNGVVILYLANNPGPYGGALQGSLAANAVNGVATFSGVSISKAGENYRLAAIAPPLKTAVGEFFDVLPQNADLAVSISASPNPVETGAALTYTVGVQNLGPLAASNLTLTVNLPSGVTFVNAGGTGWACSHSGGVVTCNRFSLAASSSAPDVAITVNAPNQAGSITATASITAASLDLVNGNNQASVNTLVVTIPETGGITIYLPLVKK